MTFSFDPEVAAVLEQAMGSGGPPPTPPVGDVENRRTALNAMLDHFNNQVQPTPTDVHTSDHKVTAPDGTTLLARWYRRTSDAGNAAVLYYTVAG